MDLTFNVIFVPQTVRYLRLAVLTLLKNSPYAYRLVANGLDEGERRLLRDFCAASDRLEYFHYPHGEMLKHGTMLNLLFQREDAPYFCMMDTDIFAIGPFAAELEKELAHCDVLSSCLPMSMIASEHLTGFSGNCLRTPAGLPLAPTYFSIYRTELFRKIISQTKVGFEVFHPARHLPDGLERYQIPDDLRKPRRLDTAKLLSILASHFGARFQHHEIANLVHIGGLSLAKESWNRKLLGKLLDPLRRPGALTDQTIAREIRKRCHPEASSDDAHAKSSSAEQELKRRRAQAVKHVVADYFSHYLRYLVDGTREPILKISDPALRAIVQRTSGLLRDLHGQEFGNA